MGRLNTFSDLFERTAIQENGCWHYTGYLNKAGYGQFYYKMKQWPAHRLAYTLCIDDIPIGMMVCHKCDNPRCINPEHLFLGTAQDNMADRDNKNRQARQQGANHPQARLTEIDVKIIKFLLKQGTQSLNRIAQTFQVGKSTIVHIKMGRQWRHV